MAAINILNISFLSFVFIRFFCIDSCSKFTLVFSITVKQCETNRDKGSFMWTKIDHLTQSLTEMVSKCQYMWLKAAPKSGLHLRVLYVSGWTFRVRPDADLLFQLKKKKMQLTVGAANRSEILYQYVRRYRIVLQSTTMLKSFSQANFLTLNTRTHTVQ